MSRKERLIVGLDMGSSKTGALICRSGEAGKLEVLGFSVAESKGWRKGVIANLDSAVISVTKAVEGAEKAAGVSVESAYVGVAGPHVKGMNTHAALTLGGTRREVGPEDVAAVIQRAQGVFLPPDRETLHVQQQKYTLDGHDGIRDPIGMTGHRLEASVHLVTAASPATQNIVAAANRAGIEVLDTVYEGLAAAEACLTADERELGVGLLDVGAGSSELVVYRQGAVWHTASIPLGGEHFTNDIAVGLCTPIPEAQKMKRAWGLSDHRKTDEVVLEVPGVGDRPTRYVNYSMLSMIIQPRAMELLELVQAELSRSGFLKQLGAGLVLTGGGAKLGGLAMWAETVLELPVRLARPTGLLRMGDLLADPAYATLVGLVVHGHRLRLSDDTAESSWVGKIWHAVQSKLFPR